MSDNQKNMVATQPPVVESTDPIGDAWDEPDTGVPPCVFCRREIPCECNYETCMCSCGRCLAPPLPFYTGHGEAVPPKDSDSPGGSAGSGTTT